MFRVRRMGQERGELCTFFFFFSLPEGVRIGGAAGSRGEGKGLKLWTDSTDFCLINWRSPCSATTTERTRQREGGGGQR